MTVVKANDGKWALVRAGERPATGRYQTNAEAWRAIDGPDPSRGERVAQWAFERDCSRGGSEIPNLKGRSP
jgi:hypothetical protein